MKVGLLTYHFSDNYGALFQAYALREWFVRRGVSAEFINYHPAHVEEGGVLDQPWRLSLLKKNATIIYKRQAHFRQKMFGDREQQKKFQLFRSDHLGIAGASCREGGELGPLVSNFDMIVCGSDQIWNPSVHRGFDPVYFLDFPGTESVYKVAYAPSFGRSEIEPIFNQELGKLVAHLDGISVREDTGLKILEGAGVNSRSVHIVPDPTILLGDFRPMLQDGSASDESVFCYALRTDEVIRDVATNAAQMIGVPLRAPRTTYQRWKDIGIGIAPGPVEWLQTLASAQLVVSNSFHGVALSVVLNRPFIAVCLPGKRAKMNARVKNLLTIAGLTDRIIETNDLSRVRTLIETPINWEGVNARIAAVRAEAESYLDTHLVKARETVA